MLASEMPIIAKKAWKNMRAEAVVIRSMRNDRKSTKPSGAKIASHLSGDPKIG